MAYRLDYELLELWRSGDREAGKELFERYYDQLYRFFATKPVTDPVDLIVETFRALVEGRERIRPSIDIRADLLATADGVLQRHLRMRRLRRGLDDSTTAARPRFAAPEHLAEDTVDDLGARLAASPVRRLGLFDTIEDEPLGGGPHLPRVRVEIILDGDLAQLDPETQRRIIEEARDKTGDPALSITSIEPESILLELDASAEAAALLEKLFESGDLKSLGGLRIIAINRVHAELPGPGATAVPTSAEAALTDFLVSAFTADELRRLVHGLSEGVRLEAALPGATASLSHLAFEAVRVLVRHGLAGASLFDRLEAERPRRLEEIRRVRQHFEATADTGPHHVEP